MLTLWKKSYDLDTTLKSRDITLPTKVHLVKAIVFLVVKYGCESFTKKKAERQTIGAVELQYWRRKWQPTPVFLSGESQGQGSLVGCCLWGHTESDMTEVT